MMNKQIAVFLGAILTLGITQSVFAAGIDTRVERRHDAVENTADRVDDKQDFRQERRDCVGDGPDCRSDNRQDKRQDTVDRAEDRVDDRRDRRQPAPDGTVSGKSPGLPDTSAECRASTAADDHIH